LTTLPTTLGGLPQALQPAGPAAMGQAAAQERRAQLAESDRRIRRVVRLGTLVSLAFFGGLGGWAAFAPLESAVMAQGFVGVESNRQTVQHFEGGIIQALLVRDGDRVAAGQPLVRLDPVISAAQQQSVRDQYHAGLAQKARLLAERDGLGAIAFPPELEARAGEPEADKLMADQRQLFERRRTAIAGRKAILQERIAQHRQEIVATEAQMSAARAQLALINEETNTVRDLVEKGYEKRPRLLALQRQQAGLQGEIGQQAATIAQTRQQIGQAELEIKDLENQQTSQVATELQEVQLRLDDLSGRLKTANAASARTELVAPRAGTIVNLRFHTPGGVIKPGDPVLDLVPEGDPLIVEAQIQPQDIDAVHPGMPARVQFTAYNMRQVPQIDASVQSVSADRMTDQRTGQSYFTARVLVPAENLAKLKHEVKLVPGMPATVSVTTGERTPLDYLLAPLTQSFDRAFKEE